MVYRMMYEELKEWVKTKALPGDVAYYFDARVEKSYFYTYKGPDDNPYWRLIFNDAIVSYFKEEINKLKVEDTTVNKRCENCKYWNSSGGYSRCDHEDQAGTFVPKFTSCDKHELKDTRTTPFDGIKFYLIDSKTGELGIKYVCEDCGKIMDKPFHWQLRVPFGANKDPDKRPGYYSWCEECWEKEKKK